MQTPQWKTLLALLCTHLATHSSHAEEFMMFYLGGQSNMDGYGLVKDLPESLNKPMQDVFIFHGNPTPDRKSGGGLGSWAPLNPGHGAGYQFKGNKPHYSHRFGPEITFAQAIKKAFPGKKIALIKYSRGGTSIHVEAARQFGCWDPDFKKGDGELSSINQYDHFLTTVRNATLPSDIDGDGELDQLIPSGILWMQGESDAAINENIASQYKENLHELMVGIQGAFRADDLPVVIGRISDSKADQPKKTWPYGKIVRQEMVEYVQDYAPAALVTSTDKYSYSDPWHYDSAGYIDLGNEFAKAMINLLNIQD